MSDEKTENVEIPVEEDVDKLKQEEKAKQAGQEADVVAEMKKLGQQFAATLQTAWDSEERKQIESDVRAGLRSFVDEVDKVIREAKQSPAADRVKHEAAEVKDKVEGSEWTYKAREGVVQGLHWLSVELDRLANQFTVPEKQPEEPQAEEAEAGAEEEKGEA